MVVFIPDLFTPYLQGQELARQANWDDLNQFNTVQQGQIRNARDIATFSPTVNQAYNTDYSQQLQNFVDTEIAPLYIGNQQLQFGANSALYGDRIATEQSTLGTNRFINDATRAYYAAGGGSFGGSFAPAGTTTTGAVPNAATLATTPTTAQQQANRPGFLGRVFNTLTAPIRGAYQVGENLASKVNTTAGAQSGLPVNQMPQTYFMPNFAPGATGPIQLPGYLTPNQGSGGMSFAPQMQEIELADGSIALVDENGQIVEIIR